MITYGNQAGRSLLEERHEMKEMMKRLEAKMANNETQMANNQTQMANNETQIADLQSRVKALTQSSEGYRKIRNRFLDIYRRDVLGDIGKQGLKNISEGNIAAHEGDAVADAELFTSGKRSDDDVLIDLYGLSSSRISDLGKYQTSLPKFYIVASLCSIARVDNFNCISILNIRATWKTKGQIIPPDVAAAFETFVKELNMNPDQDVTNGTTPLSKAYYTLTAHRKKR